VGGEEVLEVHADTHGVAHMSLRSIFAAAPLHVGPDARMQRLSFQNTMHDHFLDELQNPIRVMDEALLAVGFG